MGSKGGIVFDRQWPWPIFCSRRGIMVAGLSLLLILGACQTTTSDGSMALPAPSVRPAQLPAAQTVRYVIRPDLSELRFLVFRAGTLARLGHSHVVQANNIQGEIHLAQAIRQSSFSLVLPVADFRVDDESSRLEEGEEFAKLPDAEAIAGTTRNMLGEKVLDAARYPNIEIESLALDGPDWGPDIAVRIKLHGVEREMTVPTAIERNGEQLVVTALFSVNQSDFGITPLSGLGGAVQVANTLRVRMRLVARKA
ncbi:YceI family protein [Propionivibrio sp.]|uniref:YceI family protein n=3 Tax=Propionivibrio sp. TaxID=2212460 RepID=UPI002603623C|nr:YceI family protein [Propionivibrio sp.]